MTVVYLHAVTTSSCRIRAPIAYGQRMTARIGAVSSASGSMFNRVSLSTIATSAIRHHAKLGYYFEMSAVTAVGTSASFGLRAVSKLRGHSRVATSISADFTYPLVSHLYGVPRSAHHLSIAPSYISHLATKSTTASTLRGRGTNTAVLHTCSTSRFSARGKSSFGARVATKARTMTNARAATHASCDPVAFVHTASSVRARLLNILPLGANTKSETSLDSYLTGHFALHGKARQRSSAIIRPTFFALLGARASAESDVSGAITFYQLLGSLITSRFSFVMNPPSFIAAAFAGTIKSSASLATTLGLGVGISGLLTIQSWMKGRSSINRPPEPPFEI